MRREEGGFFALLAIGLAEAGITSLRFDLRGHGESEGRQEELTLTTILNEVFWFEPLAVLSEITASTLVVHGTRDTFVPVETSRAALPLLRAEHRLVEIEGSQHGFAVQDDPQYLNPQSQQWQAFVIRTVADWITEGCSGQVVINREDDGFIAGALLGACGYWMYCRAVSVAFHRPPTPDRLSSRATSPSC
jgi:hypothetical protein